MNTLRPTEAEALAAWAALVAADREQVERLREDRPASSDYYAPIAGSFRAGVRENLEWPALEALVRPDDAVLDIGAGGGRFSVPLARSARRVVAIEPSEAMRATLTAAATEAGVEVEVRDGRWPDPAWAETVDVSLAAHVFYDIEAIAPFLDAMEQHTRRTCVVMAGAQARGASLAPLWEAVHGEPMATLPALREFVALLGARGRRYEVRTASPAAPAEPMAREDAYRQGRRLLWLAEGSEKERRMRALMDEWYGQGDRIALPEARPFIGIVSWEPPRPA
ncbi:MAG: hypothetical protein AMXMBFR23_05350 [Chloroflexota bacterium]